MHTHYEVLRVPPTASEKQIRQAYHRAILELHPDKAQLQCTNQNSAADAAFTRVQEAWLVCYLLHVTTCCNILPTESNPADNAAAPQVLKDNSQRSAYDAELSQAQILAEVAVSDRIAYTNMQHHAEEGMVWLTHPCRCGGEYAVQADELCAKENTVLLLPCNTCSLFIEVAASLDG